MSDRGMKKWAPYKALTEQYDALEELHKKEEICEKPVLSSDEEEEINDFLVNYAGQTATFQYYRKQRVNELTSKIIKIDIPNRRLVLEDKKIIHFEELVGIKKH
ncbi:MAG: YolD-like family protein [Bacilli bacterium]|nr:YolD-like family protein [Bacilli bacterium]